MAKLAKCIEIQDTILRELQVDFDEFQNATAARKSRGYIKACLTDIEDTYKRAKTQHIAIISSASDALKDKYIEDEAFSKIKRVYFKFSGLIEDDLEKFADQNRPSLDASHLNISKSSASDIRLLRIQIKPFSGRFEDWCEFHNLFEKLIDQNSELSDVQKLQHLKNAVTGEAARLIQHLPFDGKNYSSAREILTERFENKRKLVNIQLRILIEQDKLTHESAASLKSLHDTSSECFHALANLKIAVETWDAILIYIIFHKLPPQTQRDWEAKLGTSKVLPEWKTFLSFIEARFSSLENILEINGGSKQQVASPSFRKPMAKAFHVNSQPVNKKFLCRLCKASHGIRHCKQFLNMDVKTRSETIKRHSICSNCLGYDHHASSCNSSNRCYKCGLKHHTMLHIESQVQTQNKTQYNTHNHLIRNTNHQSSVNGLNYEFNGPSTSQSVNTHFNQMQSKALLATALVKVFGSNGTHHVFRALIDPGSEATFITENATQLLKLKRHKTSANVTGLGQTSTGSSNYQVEFSICSLTNSKFSLDVRAYVFPHLTSLLPTQQLQTTKWRHLEKLPLADPSYYIPGKIDILIGADVYAHIILEGLVRSQKGSPVAQMTELGWILTGSTNSSAVRNSKHLKVQNHFNCLEELKKFWEIEENLDDRRPTQEEEKCEVHYQKTVRRSGDGRYVVSLPFKDDLRPNLGNSKSAALARFYQIERRLSGNEKLRNAYKSCITEYETLGHMKEVTTELETKNHYFLPHHAVLKESSTTTKLRVVFDASCKASSGRSLNDHLMVGPRLQPDIIDLIAKWRKFRVAFAADISKMYRQIWMAPEDTPYQLILWRATTKDPIKTFALNTVTFGTASAPYLAVRTLHQLATDIKTKHPLVSKVLTEGFYVDDLIYGSDNETDAIKLQVDIRDTLSSAGFPLRKWVSNSHKVLEQVPESEREINLPLKFDSPESIKTLGIQWHPAKDVFKFKINLPQIVRHTKRSVLADIARLFDPLGWISPCIIRAKLILQQLWLRELSWDDHIPQDIEKHWLDLRHGLSKLQEFEIPRWIEYEDSAQVQLHGFSDASERAYAAVVYARIIKNGREQVHLLTSKTRVSPSPVKCVSLPRLELCAALLLAKLLHRISRAMQFENANIFAWSDSMITLAWIKGTPSIRTTFVANRVTEIQRLTNPNSWRHVGSKENPADFGSRGVSPEELLENQMWWHGPSFLQNFSLEEMPCTVPIETDLETKERIQKVKDGEPFKNNKLYTYLQILPQCTIITNTLFQKHSTLKRIVRSVAIWRRYIHNIKNPKKRILLDTHPLTPDELMSSHNRIIKIVQNELFSEEIKALKENKPVSKKSGILNLNPFLDCDDLLRVGGRLINAPLPFSQRHPLILKDSHTVAKLIASETHQRSFHGGQQLMMAEIRNMYWITNLKRLVKSIIYKCIRCHRYNARMQQQLMGSLPVERVIISRPFTNTGVDYAGPIDIKMWKGRCNKTSKGYIAVFICLSTKAIHIELVSDLSAAGFIAAFRRFTARRGTCANMFSDCGTNFKGASNELNKDSKFITSEWSSEVTEILASQNTKWHFNPPSSPHFGGLWEAGVKSIKHHLKRTIGASKLTFEEYATLLAQIEACLNSRPLCPMTSDPDDLSVLTPGHFLIGAALNTHPDRNLQIKNINNLDRWRYLQRLTQDFWKQWSTSYIHLLQQRPKWLRHEPNIRVGDIVLVKEDNLPPSSWLLARVLELHSGSDGLTRVVTIRTKNSILKRPIAKLSPLPVSNPSNDP